VIVLTGVPAENPGSKGLMARIDDAARYFLREQMALSTQCGFIREFEFTSLHQLGSLTKAHLIASTRW
jgi:hypothetical protein